MEDLDKILSEVVRKTVKETLETIVNYPALTDGALGFPVVFSAHIHLPFRVFTYPRPVPLVKARAMFTDSSHGCT